MHRPRVWDARYKRCAGERERPAGGYARRAGKPHSQAPLKEEWEEIVKTLLGGGKRSKAS